MQLGKLHKSGDNKSWLTYAMILSILKMKGFCDRAVGHRTEFDQNNAQKIIIFDASRPRKMIKANISKKNASLKTTQAV